MIDAGGGGVFVHVPFDVEKEYGKKNMIPVKATYDGEPYRGSIANMGTGPCLIILKSIREKIGKQTGDTVSVTVELDTTPRKVELSKDIKILFKNFPDLKKFFETLSFTNQKEYTRWISEAKTEETKQRRLDLMYNKLKAGKKNPTMK